MENQSGNRKEIQNGRSEQPRQLGIGYEPRHQDSRPQYSNNNIPQGSQYRKETRDNYSNKGSQRGSQLGS